MSDNWYLVDGDHAWIKLTGEQAKDKLCKVDLDMIDKIGKHSTNWHDDGKGYPRSWSKILKDHVHLHTIVHGECDAGKEIDHADENPLNATRANLRVLTRSDNLRNRTISTRNGEPTTSKFPGVHWHKQRGKWEAQISVDGENVYLGLHDDELTAARIYRSILRNINPEIERPEWKELDSRVVINCYGATTINNQK